VKVNLKLIEKERYQLMVYLDSQSLNIRRLNSQTTRKIHRLYRGLFCWRLISFSRAQAAQTAVEWAIAVVAGPKLKDNHSLRIVKYRIVYTDYISDNYTTAASRLLIRHDCILAALYAHYYRLPVEIVIAP